MKVAFLTFRFPHPADRGDRISSLGFLEAVSPRHEVSVLAVCDSPPPPESLAYLRGRGIDIRPILLPKYRSLAQTLFALPGRAPLQQAYFRSPDMERAARELDARGPFDCLVLHSIRPLPLYPLIRAKRRILMGVDCLTLLLRRTIPHTAPPYRWVLQAEAPRVERAERQATLDMDEVWVVSEPDATAFPAAREGRVRVVRQGVAARIDADLARRSDGRTLLFVGRMNVGQNIAAAERLCQNLLPRVRQKFPHARVRVVGNSPVARVKALGRLEGVEVSGPIPDLQQAYATAAVLVAPLAYSTGIQNKLLEAAAAGLPVVTTPDPADALGSAVARELWTASSDEEFEQVIAGVLSDPRAAEERAARARVAVRETFKWTNLLEALEHPPGGPA